MTRKERKTAVSSLLFGLAVGDALGVPVEYHGGGNQRFSRACLWQTAIPAVWLESLAGYGEINRIAGTLAEALTT
jgi:hypothetical protein